MALVGEYGMIKLRLSFKSYSRCLSMLSLEMIWKVYGGTAEGVKREE